MDARSFPLWTASCRLFRIAFLSLSIAAVCRIVHRFVFCSSFEFVLSCLQPYFALTMLLTLLGIQYQLPVNTNSLANMLIASSFVSFLCIYFFFHIFMRQRAKEKDPVRMYVENDVTSYNRCVYNNSRFKRLPTKEIKTQTINRFDEWQSAPNGIMMKPTKKQMNVVAEPM